METDRKASRGDVEHLNLETLLRRPSLRVNIPRRVSQVCRESALTEDTTCGVACIRGEWLQSFANRKSFIFTYGVLESFYGSYYAYFYGTITTLEKRFQMSSQTTGSEKMSIFYNIFTMVLDPLPTHTGTITTVSDLIQIIACWALSLLVVKPHKPRWIGVGIWLVVASTITASLPHFLYEPGKVHNETLHGTQQSCSKEPETCIENPSERTIPTILLIVAQILQGIGGTLYFTLGRLYEDKNIQKHQTPSLLSLLSILKIVGPAFGYWLSSVCLKIYVSPNLKPPVDENDVHWIGAWWLGNLIIGFLLVIPGLMIVLFPTTLPKAAIQKIFKEAIEKTQSITDDGEKTSLKKFSINSTFKSNNFASILNILGFIPYFIFLPKYVEIQYGLTASSANLIMGSLTLIFSACGIVIGNSIITRYRLPARALISWKIFVNILSIGSLISYIYLGCSANDEQVKSMTLQHADLNTTCRCPDNLFSPVCVKPHQTFLSPCHAICKQHEDTQPVTICNADLVATKTKNLLKGVCPVDCYFNFIVFTIITSSTSFVHATAYASDIWLETKLKEKPHKSIGLNLGMNFLSLITSVPQQIIFGYILDNFCLLWGESCNGTGNCWLYDAENLRYYMNLIAVALSTIVTIYNMGLWYSASEIELFDDDQYMEEDDEY